MANEPDRFASAQKRFLAQQYEKETFRAAGAGEDSGVAGPPYWDRSAWEKHKAQYGQYPYSANGPFPDTMEGAPDWVYELMGLRKPPVDVRLGSAGADYGQAGDLSLWKVR